MRILHLIPSFGIGGAERQLSYLAPELLRREHHVYVAYEKDGVLKPSVPDSSLYHLKSLCNYDPLLLMKIIYLIRHIRPDVVHTWLLQMDILGGIAAQITGAKWILREPSSAIAYQHTWKYRLRIKIARYSAAVVSNSTEGDLYWNRYYPDKKRFVIRNGLPLNEIDESEGVIIDDLGVKNAEPMVLFVGRLINYKNVDKLIEALNIIREVSPIKLIVCGEGPMYGVLKKQVSSLGLAERVRFTGFLDNRKVWALMKRADMFCSLSNFEGSPNAVLEAMACGCPLVVSDIPAHRELLNSESALLVNQDNVQNIASAILSLVSNKENGRLQANIARKKAMQFSILDMASQYESVYEWVRQYGGLTCNEH